MIFRRSYSDPFRRSVPAACHGLDPVSMMAVSGLTTLATTGISAASRSQQTQEAADQANYMAQVARNNQQVANWNAERALQQGQVQVDQQQLKTAQKIGTQRALLASQGGDIDSGSDVDLIGDTARTGAFDAATTANNAQNTAYGYRLQADAAAGQASDYGSQASNDWLNFDNSLLNSSTKQNGLL